ncbi:HIT family protein [Apilactobacillus kunkeei]|uniref:Histidine triad protein n=2 Tax=Apilactobacillus TaxID=2767877 RepID=A0A087EQB8_9LACO|nr:MULTISPECIES: HIT family protein [Lactobacillaceae]ALJ31975.1 histidine triad protein [Apilactobacillus kunkeei]KFJ15469.1 histidine triad protein [Apilactobacillus kunkeei]KOY71147.1 Histidine triad protein [Apilactobacillus kunkeei]KOY76115.1 Histidine triad protein [Apilactobacillus kunkeei]KPN81179.1 Histidine triad protein [Apilactobacillus kunkeei]
MSDCVFCKIIDGEIPSYTIYEDEYVKAFLDISQATPGHTLVVPKKHVANIYEYDEKLAEQVFSRIPKIARAIQKSAPDILGMNIVNNNGELAYQSVFHSHFHLIPRYSENDGFSMSFQDNSDKYNEEAFEQIKANIISSLEE